ncbi:cobalt-precorrin-5B C(1)-methyltransferase [Synergistales bacterium]|nr:cobalt-precorrin-5B C(1)-methyltransferase [Synergistales bacterium]
MERRGVIDRSLFAGIAAAGLAGAAVRWLRSLPCSDVAVTLPSGEVVFLCADGCRRTERGAEAWLSLGSRGEITLSVELTDEGTVDVLLGHGVDIAGSVDLAALSGYAAMNPAAIELVRNSVFSELPSGRGAKVGISVRETNHAPVYDNDNAPPPAAASDKLASVDDVTLKMALEGINNVRFLGADTICLVPGKYGRRVAELSGVPAGIITHMGNGMGDALAAAGTAGFRNIILVGQVSKFSKFSVGSLDTHTSKSDGRLAAIAAYAAMHGAGADDVRGIMSALMADEAAAKIIKTDWGKAAFRELADCVVKTALTCAKVAADCAALTFCLPDRELARTDNFDAIIERVKK